MRSARRARALWRLQRRCSAAVAEGGAGGDAAEVPEAEYWKTLAHHYEERLQQQVQFTSQCARMSKGFADAARGWEYWPHDTRAADELTYDAFFEGYAKAQRPVVIDGLAPCPASWGTLQRWKDGLADAADLPTAIYAPGEPRAEVERLAPREALERFARRASYPPEAVDDWAAPVREGAEPLRTVEFALPSTAPWMLGEFTVPRYFAQDLRQFAHQADDLRRTQVVSRDELEAATPRAALPAVCLGDDVHIISHTPTVTIGPRGVQTTLQQAPFSNHRWVHVAQGSVDVMVFGADFAPCLYEQEYLHYAVDAFAPDFEAFPSAVMAYPWKMTVREGQTLFIPADALHQMRFVEDATFVSMDFVDWSNVEAAVYDVERMAECGHPAFRELRRAFNMQFLSLPEAGRNAEPQDIPYSAYLVWRNEVAVEGPKA